MELSVQQYLHACNMDIDNLGYQILKDAEQGDLLPTALISKYDVTLERLMDVLKAMLLEGFLILTEGKWLRITEKGEQCIIKTEEETADEIEHWKSSYIDEFFSRSSTVEVNEPYLPSTEACKIIMEGESKKETSN